MTPEAIRKRLTVVVCKRLRDARLRVGLSQLTLAKTIGIGGPMVSMVERGKRLPSLEIQMLWAGACQVFLAEVYEAIEGEVFAAATRSRK